MKKLIKNPFSILLEIVTLVLAVLWYLHSREYEPLITMISLFSALVASISLIYCSRPKIELLLIPRNDYGRNHRGFSANNPSIILPGAKNVNIHWELFWIYDIEVRNNSFQNAYSISFDYFNMPKNTRIDNKIGEIEPILAHEAKTIRLKVIETTESTVEQADERLKVNKKNLLSDAKIDIKYKNESGSLYGTIFTCVNNNNKLYKPCKIKEWLQKIANKHSVGSSAHSMEAPHQK
jgi:hypothetical protein